MLCVVRVNGRSFVGPGAEASSSSLLIFCVIKLWFPVVS